MLCLIREDDAVVEHRPTGSMEVLPGEIWGLQDEIIEDEGETDEQVVPLEKDKSNMVPPIITPSEEVLEAAGTGDDLGRILDKAHGEPWTSFKPPPAHKLADQSAIRSLKKCNVNGK